MRARDPVEGEVIHQGSGWYNIILDGEVVETGIRGETEANRRLEQHLHT